MLHAMSSDLSDLTGRLRASRIGVVLALLTIFSGFAMGGVMGAFEEELKSGLAARANAAASSVYGGDAAKSKSVLDKSWAYYKRAHLHGGGIGAAALGLILLLALLERPSASARRSIALALGLGGLGYSSFWVLAARAAPSLGSMDAAKESLRWLAVPSAGLLLTGLVVVAALALRELFTTGPS
ncbi:MAG: hypothetical protein B6D46_13665 [Polyangiaceae bacterium UTPRO1]|jgi:hypothetical protein|nr:MAG: hypothetical protein B6D46_13665 [Polyangiaceae bacterium UTPRO1]